MFDRNLMRIAGMPAIMAALAVLAVLQAASIIGQSLTLSKVLSELWAGTPVADVLPSLTAFAACFITLQLVRFAQDTMLDRFARERAKELRGALLERVFDADALLARNVGAANVVDVATAGVDDVETYLRIIPPKIIGMAMISIPILVCAYVADWPSGIILTVMFPVIIFFMVLLGKQARERSERQYGAYTRLTNRFIDTLRGLKTILSFGAGEREGESVHEHSERLRHATVKTLRTATLSSAVLDLCATFGVAAVAIMLAFRLMDGSLTLEIGLVALMLAPEYFTPIRSFASDYHASLDGKNALAALLSMLEGDDAGRAPSPSRLASAIAPWSSASSLSLQDVSFSYDGMTCSVPAITFSVGGFQNVGIIGASGAGKSTLADILAGFKAPTSGTILLDGTRVSLTCDAWRSQVRYVPQHPSIFRMSLADNVRFYNPQATDEQVEAAIAAVGLTELLRELPEGIDTLVGEGNRSLSGGEAHRVALARILLDDDARILVFDEPTAHLDIETELELKGPMLDAMKGRLVFFATHRLHWTRDLDSVIDLSAQPESTQGAAS